MPDLAFRICGAEAARMVVAPAITLRLEISSNPPTQAIQTVLLNCQIQIEAPRRRYTPAEQEHLRDLFGEPDRWGQTLRPLLWTNLTTTVPAFIGSTEIQLAVPCTIDFNVTATKYFHGVAGGVPITLLFSGTVFCRTAMEQLQATPIPRTAEARFTLPAGVWEQGIRLHHPNSACLVLRRDVFDRLYDFKIQHDLATFDDALERMMEVALEAEV